MLPYIALGNEAGMPRGAFRALLLLTNSPRAGARPLGWGWRALLLLPAGPRALPAPSFFVCTVVFFVLVLFWMEPRPRDSRGMVCGDPKSCCWSSCRGCGGSHRVVLGVGDTVMCDGMGTRVMGWVQELSTHGCIYKQHHHEPSGAARSAPCGSDVVDRASKLASKVGLV